MVRGSPVKPILPERRYLRSSNRTECNQTEQQSQKLNVCEKDKRKILLNYIIWEWI